MPAPTSPAWHAGRRASAPDGAGLLGVDRTEPGAYDAVATKEWDEVVEVAWDPVLVTGALAALADRARHWTLVSSVSVYADATAIGSDESAPLLEPDDASNYGKAKVAAELGDLCRALVRSPFAAPVAPRRDAGLRPPLPCRLRRCRRTAPIGARDHDRHAGG